MAHGIKHSKQITLCKTNTVMLLIIVIITATWFLPICKINSVGLLKQKKFMYKVGKILILWGEKGIAGIAIFKVVGCHNHVGGIA